MQREYLFRGKREDNKEWVCGSYHYCDKKGVIRTRKWGTVLDIEEEHVQFDNHWILVHHTPDTVGWSIRDSFTPYAVIPETVGLLMPIKDANGIILFEGDIVSGNRTPDNFGPSILFPKRTEYRLVEYTNTETKSTFELPIDISYSERIPENHIHWILAGNKFDNPELLKLL